MNTFSTHRVTIWAHGARGWPVTCACGWRYLASSRSGAYAAKRSHLTEVREAGIADAFTPPDPFSRKA